VFGHASFDTTTSVLVGAVPGVYLGAHISSRANDRYIRPVLVAVLVISSLKLLNVPNAALLSATIAFVVAGAVWFPTKAVRDRRAARSRSLVAA
jgi:hypothetical protein